jgi:uncharacterized damage-inducible protein DinB
LTVDAKALLLARLAQARAALWQELVGLDNPTIATEHICGAWTAADALAHVAAWDEIYTTRIELILEGRPGEIVLSEADPINARIFAERHGWSLERAVDGCNRVRREFLALIDPVPWEEMIRPHRTANRVEYSIQDFTERRAFHDGLHTDDLRSWRKYAQPASRPGPRMILRAALDAARDELLAWVVVVPEEQRTTLAVCGSWNVQDVLGHIADWERYSVNGLDEIAAGRVAGAEYDGDEDRWNHEHATARRGQEWATIWEDLETVRRQLLARLDGMTDADLARTVRTKWSDTDSPYGWIRVNLDHDREHAETIRETLTARR